MPYSFAADRVRLIGGSKILAFSGRVKGMTGVLNLTAGAPVQDPPQGMIDAVIAQAQKPGGASYTNVAGDPDVRRVVAAAYSERLGTVLKPEHVVLCGGVKPAIFLAVGCVLNAGDRLLTAAPFWPSYEGICDYHGAHLQAVPTRAEDGYFMTPAQLRDGLQDEAVKMVMFCSPGNPTGQVMSAELMEEYADVLDNLGRPVVVLLDEIYADIIFDGDFDSLASRVLRQPVVILNGISKGGCAPGWRGGYIVCLDQHWQQRGDERPLWQLFADVQGEVIGHPSRLATAAIPAALADEDFRRSLCSSFGANAQMAVTALRDMPRVTHCEVPQGAIYAFVEIDRPGPDAVEALLKAGVAVSPGEWFGLPNSLRIFIGVSTETMVEALSRIRTGLGAMN